MRWANPTARLAAGLACLLLGLAAVATLTACGDDDDDGGSATSPATEGSSPAAKSGPGTITVTSASPITGQSRKVLLVYAAPQAGGAPLSEACIQLGSDRVTVPATMMTDKKGEGAPCTGSGGPTKFPEGTYTLIAGIYAPPSQTADKEVSMTVEVKGDITVQIDGSALSK